MIPSRFGCGGRPDERAYLAPAAALWANPFAGGNRDSTRPEVNLKAIQDMVAATRVGDHGVAFVVDTRGRVIAHSDGGMVQRDFSDLAHVQAATLAGPIPAVQTVQDINGRQVLATHAIVARPTLTVFVELPVEEATK